MHKYNGRVIFQGHDQDGIVEIVESDGVRSLHFGSESRQSCIQLNKPDALYLSYIRAMMAWQLYTDQHDHVLMIGLGGGTLARHLLMQLDVKQITAIELRKLVRHLARQFFFLPMDSRLKLITDDGGAFIRRVASGSKQYDLLFVDAFADDAMSDAVTGSAFFDACKQSLSRQGIMVINLWDTDQQLFETIALSIADSFKDQVLFLPVKDKGNIIVLCFAAGVPKIQYSQILKRAKQLESQTGIEFTLFARSLNRYNPHLINQIKRL